MRRGAGALCLLASLAACGPRTARFPTSERSETEPVRRAPGVAVDPRTELPAPSSRGESNASLLVLSAPRDVERAKALVHAFFVAITLESADALDLVLSSDAYLESSSGRNPARQAWRSRFAQFDYGSLRSAPLFRTSDLETYRGREHAALAATRRLPPHMQPDDVFVRVHLEVTHVSKTRLFADELGFLLRPSEGGYRITTISEDFQTP
jgi:hypothetical protein